MAFPNYPKKHCETSLVDPSEYAAYLKSQGHHPTFAPPEGVVVCYSPRLMKSALAKYNCRQGNGSLLGLGLDPLLPQLCSKS